MKRSLNPMGRSLLAISMGLLLQTQSADANLSSIFKGKDIEPETLEIMGKTAEGLYTSSSKSVGDKKEWINEDTGTRGIVEIVELRDNCVKLFHYVEIAKPAKTREVAVWRCRTADGTWQLTPLD